MHWREMVGQWNGEDAGDCEATIAERGEERCRRLREAMLGDGIHGDEFGEASLECYVDEGIEADEEHERPFEQSAGFLGKVGCSFGRFFRPNVTIIKEERHDHQNGG